MGQPSICPVCGGRQVVGRWLYEAPSETCAYLGESDVTEDEANAGATVPCRSCSGTGVVWPPQPIPEKS